MSFLLRKNKDISHILIDLGDYIKDEEKFINSLNYK